MHQILILHSPVHFDSSDQTSEPRSLCDRMVSSRKGALISRITERKQRRGWTKVWSRSEVVPCSTEDPGSALFDQGDSKVEEKGMGKATKDADGESSVQTRERRSVHRVSACSVS
jgi:hypothetical protein